MFAAQKPRKYHSYSIFGDVQGNFAPHAKTAEDAKSFPFKAGNEGKETAKNTQYKARFGIAPKAGSKLPPCAFMRQHRLHSFASLASSA
jgi:hypothetical protein